MKLSYTVDAAHDGREIRQLASSTLELSAKLWKHIKWNGTILVNGKAIRNVRLCVKAGDELTLLWQEASPVVPVDLPLDVLYEDEAFLIVNKPAAISGAGERQLASIRSTALTETRRALSSSRNPRASSTR